MPVTHKAVTTFSSLRFEPPLSFLCNLVMRCNSDWVSSLGKTCTPRSFRATRWLASAGVAFLFSPSCSRATDGVNWPCLPALQELERRLSWASTLSIYAARTSGPFGAASRSATSGWPKWCCNSFRGWCSKATLSCLTSLPTSSKSCPCISWLSTASRTLPPS